MVGPYNMIFDNLNKLVSSLKLEEIGYEIAPHKITDTAGYTNYRVLLVNLKSNSPIA